MELFGREYGFLYSVGAQQEISEKCPGEDIKRLGEVGSTIKARTDLYVDMICILSRWHEKAEHFKAVLNGEEYEEHPITRELLEILDGDQFAAVQLAAFQAMRKDKTPTVEAEAPKKNESAEA